MATTIGIGFIAAVVTPNDNANLPGGPCAGLWVSGAGTVQVIPVGSPNDASIPLGSVAAATLVPIAIKRVLATGTSATNIQALYA
jgi:hypothetical protein